jgi:hypothetical protein
MIPTPVNLMLSVTTAPCDEWHYPSLSISHNVRERAESSPNNEIVNDRQILIFTIHDMVFIKSASILYH